MSNIIQQDHLESCPGLETGWCVYSSWFGVDRKRLLLEAQACAGSDNMFKGFDRANSLWKKNLVLDQCWHADELCSGVARGTMIMVRACRIVVGAPTVQEELITNTLNRRDASSAPAHHFQSRDIILKGLRSQTLCYTFFVQEIKPLSRPNL